MEMAAAEAVAEPVSQDRPVKSESLMVIRMKSVEDLWRQAKGLGLEGEHKCARPQQGCVCPNLIDVCEYPAGALVVCTARRYVGVNTAKDCTLHEPKKHPGGL